MEKRDVDKWAVMKPKGREKKRKENQLRTNKAGKYGHMGQSPRPGDTLPRGPRACPASD